MDKPTNTYTYDKRKFETDTPKCIHIQERQNEGIFNFDIETFAKDGKYYTTIQAESNMITAKQGFVRNKLTMQYESDIIGTLEYWHDWVKKTSLHRVELWMLGVDNE